MHPPNPRAGWRAAFPHPKFLIFGIAFSLGLTSPALSQAIPGLGSTSAPAVSIPADPFGRETPRGLAKSLLGTMSGAGGASAADVLQLPDNIKNDRQIRLDIYLKSLQQALDRSGKLDEGWNVSAEAEGRHGDGLPEDQEQIGFIAIEKTQIPIIAVRLPAKDATSPALWMVSHDSLRAIHDASSRLSLSLVDRLTPKNLPEILKTQFFGVPLAHYVFTLITASLLLLASYALVRSVIGVIIMLFRLDRAKPRDNDAERQVEPVVDQAATEPPEVKAEKPASKTLAAILVLRPMLVTMMVGMALEPLLAQAGISVVLRGMLAPLVRISIVIAFTFIMIRFVDRLIFVAVEKAEKSGRSGSISFLIIGRRAAKITLSCVAILAALSAVGVDLTAGLTALGIGGIAIALGSQKTIGDFVGSLSVVADRVVKIGDVCRFGTILGTVEDIGIRSTRIRTLDRTVLTIPNGMFSSIEIENFSDRDMWRFYHQIAVSPATSKQLEDCLKDLRFTVFSHESCEQERGRVRLANFTGGLPNVEFVVYFHAEDMFEFAAIQEEVLLGIMEVIERHGLKLGLPSQFVHMKPFPDGAVPRKNLLTSLLPS